MSGDSNEYFEFVEDITLADIAVHCKAKTVEKIFKLNAEALLHVCLEEPSKLKKVEKCHVLLQHNYLDLLLVKFLNELLFIKDTRGLLVYPETIQIIYSNDAVICEAHCTGDYITNGYDINIDPKAVTMHKVKCEKINDDEWESFIVIDV
ncbi:MAG: archease [Spirochaetes bacterium]|nr:archease [Spirochaetota bacterium]